MRATWQKRSGFSDYELPPVDVEILGFVVASYEPGYQRHGSKTCTLAVVADPDGRLSHAELVDLTYIKEPRP